MEGLNFRFGRKSTALRRARICSDGKKKDSRGCSSSFRGGFDGKGGKFVESGMFQSLDSSLLNVNSDRK
jgi:hypothetical protein